MSKLGADVVAVVDVLSADGDKSLKNLLLFLVLFLFLFAAGARREYSPYN